MLMKSLYSIPSFHDELDACPREKSMAMTSEALMIACEYFPMGVCRPLTTTCSCKSQSTRLEQPPPSNLLGIHGLKPALNLRPLVARKIHFTVSRFVEKLLVVSSRSISGSCELTWNIFVRSSAFRCCVPAEVKDKIRRAEAE
eukprot:766090-Hanusia_phi.AAC.4